MKISLKHYLNKIFLLSNWTNFRPSQILTFAAMKAEILTIGDEILIGQTIDTNSAWIAEQLYLIGIGTNRIVSISDTKKAILEAIDDSFSRADLIVMTGGLGPTQDDITKETLTEYFQTELITNQEVLEGITEFFSSRGKEMLEGNTLQADLPKDAVILMNTRGTAMGMWFEKQGKVLISMPGVPYEMQGIMREYGLEKLKTHFNPPVIIHRTVLTQGIGESFLAEQISDWETSLRNEGLSLAYLPSPGIVKLRISGFGARGNEGVIKDRIDYYIEELERRLSPIIFGRDKETLAGVVGMLLQKHGKTLSTAESCTGGYLAHLITSVAGASNYFLGSAVVYSNTSKVEILGVESKTITANGPVSEAVVKQMAEGARRRFGSTYALATTGVAGPESPYPEVAPGTIWLAIAGPNGTRASMHQFGKSRSRNITVSALTVLNWLRNEILTAELE